MRRTTLVAAMLSALMLAPEAGAQTDFDPGGRGTRPRPRPTPRPRKPPKPRKGPKKPDVDKLIKRYTGIVMAKPHEPFPLQKLAELYRQRDGKLDKLVEEFEKRANTPGSDQFNARLALSGIYVQAGRKGDAAQLLEKAIADKPKSSSARLMAARLAKGRNDATTAKKHFEAALPLMKRGIEKERVLRSLMLLSVELNQIDEARKYHQSLVRSANNSLFVRKELGNELYNRGKYKLAEEEFRKIVKAATGDNRALAPALRDLGKALAKQKKMDEALKTLKRARRVAGSQAGIRREILFLLTDIFREQGKLTELIAILEGEGGRDFQRLATIGSLYEETGQVDKALATYRQALAIDGKNIDVRVQLVHLLQTAGQLQEAIKEYEALIKAAPHNADFVFELAETLIQRGERDKALKLVEDLERRTKNEGDILAAVADFYERIEEPKRAIKVLERLAKLPQGDPQYIVDLGDRYFQEGDKKKAVATWARIKTIVGNRARANAILGETYLDHDMPDEALAAFREAVKLAPNRQRYRKQLAIALERTATASYGARYRYTEALKIWHELLKEAGDDQLLARECRTHIVSLWAVTKRLKERVDPLRKQFEATPPDLSAGRLLAEVQRRLRRHENAEKTLRAIIKQDPGDESAMLALERVLVLQRDLAGAIDVLKKLVEVNPKRARQYYQRMAQYAAELYRDDDAIKYAAKAVELSPNDAQGHFKLGEMYRRRQNTERAMIEFRKAIKKNDRLFRAYFALAELLVSNDKVEEADRLYRRVVRSSRDEQYVMRAARQSMQINLGRGTLESLERELLPVALGNPQKPVYRRLLVELYGAMTFPLVNAARLGQGPASQAAREKLATIGARAVKPLLDALSDPKVSQQRIAIEVLAYVQNKGAGPALFNYAVSQAERELRIRAMVACGALADPSLLPRYEKLLRPDASEGPAPGDAVAVAAVWGVARMKSRQAEGLLASLIGSPSPDVRALAALGLGLSGNQKHAPDLAKLARSPESGPTARAAAAHALGELGEQSQRALLLALTDAAEAPVRRAAVLSLARLAPKGSPDDELGAIVARALLGEDAEMRRVAMAAATATATGDYRRGDALPVPDGPVVLSDVLRRLAPDGYTKGEQADALVAMRGSLVKASRAAVSTSPGRARVVAELVAADLLPLLDGTGEAPAAAKAKIDATREAVAAASVDGFVALARHPSLDVRKRAVAFLASRDEPAAQAALVAALDPRDPDVCKTALANLQTNGDGAVTAVVKLLENSDSWSLRRHAAEALARVGLTGPQKAAAEAALTRSVTEDEYALVREAAMRSAAQRGPAFARPVLQKVAQNDAEPRLRKLATELLSEPAP